MSFCAIAVFLLDKLVLHIAPGYANYARYITKLKGKYNRGRPFLQVFSSLPSDSKNHGKYM